MRTLTSQQLTQAALDSRDFSEVVEAAARFLGNPLVIIAAATGSIVGHSRELTPPDDTWLAAVDRGYITLEFVATLANWDHYKDRDPSRRYECITVTAINGRPRRFYKLTVRGQLLGYLNITRLDESFDTLPEEDCHFAAQLLATELYLQYKAMDTGAAAGTADASFLLDLIRGTFRSRAHFVDRIALSSFRTDRAYRVLSVELEEFFSYNAGEDTFKRELLAVFRRPVLAIDEHLLYLVVEEGEVTGSAAAGPMAELDRVLKKWKLICGISDPIVDLYEFDRYRRQALEAAGLRRYLLDPPASYTFFDAVKSYSLLCRIPGRSCCTTAARRSIPSSSMTRRSIPTTSPPSRPIWWPTARSKPPPPRFMSTATPSTTASPGSGNCSIWTWRICAMPIRCCSPAR